MNSRMVQPIPQPSVDALLILFPRSVTSIKSFKRVQAEIFFYHKKCMISYLSSSLSLSFTFDLQAFTTFEKCRLGMVFGTKRSGCFFLWFLELFLESQLIRNKNAVLVADLLGTWSVTKSMIANCRYQSSVVVTFEYKLFGTLPSTELLQSQQIVKTDTVMIFCHAVPQGELEMYYKPQEEFSMSITFCKISIVLP